MKAGLLTHDYLPTAISDKLTDDPTTTTTSTSASVDVLY